ncbi:hypothetical protein ACVWXO_008875 [Bradyrhizobium sp. LM2.7]
MAHTQFRNEAGFPTAPADAGVVTGPLPGMMAMKFGDPIEEALPPEAVEKFRALQLKRDEAGILVRSAIEDQQELMLEIQRHRNRIKQLQIPRGEGGFDLDDSSPQVVAEQKKLDRKLSDQRRLTAQSEARGAILRSASDVIRNIEQAVAGRPGGTIGRMVVTETPAHKGSVIDAVENRRRRLRELQADLHRIRSSPWPSAVVKQRMRQQIADLAARGRPDASRAVEIAENIEWPRSPERMEIISTAADVYSYATGALRDATALVAWLFQDQLVAALDREINAVSDDHCALDDRARAQKEAEVLADILAGEREEVALIDLATAQGVLIDYRVDCDPRAILDFEWVAAPAPVPREGDGQAGIVRRVGP